MAETCGASCAKFMLFVFNFVFFVSGAALLGIGIWLLADNSLKGMMDVVSIGTNGDQIKMVSYILIGIGVFVFIAGFLGCCGALKESKCMLGLYIFLLLVVMGVEIAAGVLALVYKDKVEKELESSLIKELTEDQFYNFTTGKYEPFGVTLNIAQNKLKCCGVNKPTDYVNSTFRKNNPILEIPYSCCKLKNDTSEKEKSMPSKDNVKDWDACLKEYQNKKESTNELHNKGCKEGILDWAKTKLIMLTGIGLGVAALELLGIILAFLLCRGIGEEM